jgi:hypothetical protein
LVELRKEGFVAKCCDRREGPYTKDLFGFGDVMGYDPTHLRRPRLVNGCLADVQPHIRKYLFGDIEQPENPRFGPNEHLVHLLTWFDLWIYSFVKRGARGKRKLWTCRKWKAILSPEGKVSFELEEMIDPLLRAFEQDAIIKPSTGPQGRPGGGLE